MLKSELKALSVKYSSIFRLSNDLINFIIPFASFHIDNIGGNTPRFHAIDVRNQYLSNLNKPDAERIINSYFYEFNLKLHDFQRELALIANSVDFANVSEITKLADIIKEQIKKMLTVGIDPKRVNLAIDTIMEFGVHLSALHSYYSNIEYLIKNFGLTDEVLYLRVNKLEDEDLNYDELQILIHFIQAVLSFIFREYSSEFTVSIDSGSNVEVKVGIPETIEAVAKVKDTFKDQITAFFNSLIKKEKSATADLIKKAKSLFNIIDSNRKNDLKVAKKIFEEINDDEYYKSRLKEIDSTYDELRHKGMNLMIENFSKIENMPLSIAHSPFQLEQNSQGDDSSLPPLLE